jgi:2-(1,2-epoxy-1,2-dihydrophenyl)acetyl-CoA isomerase
MEEAQVLLSSVTNGVFSLRMNRPKVNAINFELIAALQQAFRRAQKEAEIRCVVLSGAGGVFSAGQDITDFGGGEAVSFRYHLQRTYNPLVVQIRKLEKPVIASIHGAASGAALGLALACDMRIASEQARFVVGFNGIGLAPDSAVSLLLPAIIGLGRAAEHTYTNQPISADQALSWGLVNRVVPADQLEAETQALAERLALGPVGAMGLAKRAFNKAVLGDLEKVLDYEAHLQEIAGKGGEHKEGVSAFLEKRKPNFYSH